MDSAQACVAVGRVGTKKAIPINYEIVRIKQNTGTGKSKGENKTDWMHLMSTF